MIEVGKYYTITNKTCEDFKIVSKCIGLATEVYGYEFINVHIFSKDRTFNGGGWNANKLSQPFKVKFKGKFYENFEYEEFNIASHPEFIL